METSEILALHHRRVVDDFIEGVLSQMDLGDLERNVLGLVLRRELETELVPGIVAIQAVFHAADAATLARDLPKWLDRVSSVMPAESAFMIEMGRRFDPGGAVLMDENLGLRLGEAEVQRALEAQLWEIAPCVSRSLAP